MNSLRKRPRNNRQSSSLSNVSVTNEISDQPFEIRMGAPELSGIFRDEACTFCEIVMQYVDKAIGEKRSRDHIENVVHNMCNHLPKTYARDCNHFVDEYGDVLITILTNEVSPKEICSLLGLCKISIKQIEGTAERTDCIDSVRCRSMM